ncbi:hypothetical protein COCSUDRAFT_31853 [Coccomyxa subellipsoidea C-169]|uniref:Uncharacterized protein n=1 Tax=Coccomyxa subellipsoidea (strain C-169) TaxID=574566 RepID=I0YI61_COCSC|nr:hypothetical protein COCSUDRAFT_31853 [Coccomyxa subellipsoidea C-169]EIE18080.1 hypothetical protein COCSUDRAFT_31853 [Coccomyxa subellipsoidea C-169]|eukprot:XP_005642624.1 hypothetical protein COCSUDRAFT_31853 [Coccomyxa subellipsoidea C-169]
MPALRDEDSTLVLYTFSDTDPEYLHNLEYFIQYGLGGKDVEYIFIVQQTRTSKSLSLPALPENARYIEHENECYDWGTIGWALQTGKVDPQGYKFLILMNSSVRGPFLPSYHSADIHWTRLYTQRIDQNVKLVGSTISCQPIYWNSDTANEMRRNPHVQSYIVAMDQASPSFERYVGLHLLQSERTIFQCYKRLHDVVWFSEVGASRAVLKAGYSIDALMNKYTGVDWRNETNWDCNAGQNPYDDFAYDGLMINPLEVLFVKIKSYQLESNWITSKMAITYERWHRDQGHHASMNLHEFDKGKFSYFLSKGIAMSMRGSDCFDLAYYQRANTDMPTVNATWQHFISYGQFEGRPFRFTCAEEYSRPSPNIIQKAAEIARHSMHSSFHWQLLEQH